MAEVTRESKSTPDASLTARRKPNYVPLPRILDIYQVACRLGACESTFRNRRKKLEELGFPKKDEELGGWDADAIEAWFDRRSGLETGFSFDLEAELRGWDPSP